MRRAGQGVAGPVGEPRRAGGEAGGQTCWQADLLAAFRSRCSRRVPGAAQGVQRVQLLP